LSCGEGIVNIFHFWYDPVGTFIWCCVHLFVIHLVVS